LPPLDAKEWLLWLALAAGADGVLEGLFPHRRWSRWLARAALAAAVPWLLLRPLLSSSGGSLLQGAAWIGGLGAAVLFLRASLTSLAGLRPGASVLLLLWAVAGATSGVLLVSGSASLAQLAGALAAALAAGAVLAWWLPASPLARGGTAVPAAVLPGLWIYGHFYGETPAASAVLLCFSPVAAWAGESRAVQRLGPRMAAMARLAAALLPLAAAVAVAWAASPSLDDAGY
jgi:hypothetical protein